jgi:hypothetical protein
VWIVIKYLRFSRVNRNTLSATLLFFIGNEWTNVKSNFNRAILRWCFHRERKRRNEYGLKKKERKWFRNRIRMSVCVSEQLELLESKKTIQQQTASQRERERERVVLIDWLNWRVAEEKTLSNKIRDSNN